MTDTTTTTVPAVEAPNWTTGLDADLIGSVQNRGWDKLAPDAAAREAVKAHKEAERSLGVPADRRLALPADKNLTTWDGWTKLGKPATAAEYDFSTVKFKDGSALDDGLVTTIRKAAFANNSSKEGAIAIAKEIVGYVDGTDTTNTTIDAAALLAEKTKLRDQLGKNYDAGLVIAQRVAEVFKLTPEMVTAMEGQVGYAQTMLGLIAIGSKIGEDKFLNIGGGGNGGPISKEQAEARISELKGDPAWVGSEKLPGTYLGGDVTKNKELQALIAISRAQ